MKNILMCLQQLDIGGVETAVLTMCKGYKKAGYNVYVAAKEGVYSKELEKLNIPELNIEYDISNEIPFDKQKELKEFIIENKITEVQIHQYPCVAYFLPICLELNIPYIAFVHSIVTGAPEWFMNTFPVYKTLLPIFFENARKVICIAESTKNEIESLFDIDKDKYKIVPNSLYFDEYNSKEASDEIKTFGIAARLSPEKLTSVEKAIELFQEYSKTHKDCELLIAGSGESEKEIKDFAGKNDNIKFLGSLTNMQEFYSKLDIFLGVDRCVLEATAMKVLTVISSYQGSLNILTNKNIEEASLVNFSGQNLEDDEDILNKINKMTKSEYKKIVDKNYEFIDKKYNIENNLQKDEYKVDYAPCYKRLIDVAGEEAIKYNKLINNNVKKPSIIRRILSKIKRTIFK